MKPASLFHFTLSSSQFLPFTTLALGSALALFLYPHALTGTLSSNSRGVIKRNTAFLPIYSLMLGLLALFGYMAIAAHVVPLKAYGSNGIVPALIAKEFPSWFTGFALAAISIGALVPASIMSIAAANLFTRNIYRTYIRPNYSDREEATVAKTASLVVKLGALLAIIFIPATQIINFQLLGGIIIIQTLPAVFLGLYTNWFNRWALIIGWAGGMIAGIYMFIAANDGSVFTFVIGGQKYGIYSALSSVILNVVLAVILTPIFVAVGLRSGKDDTSPTDYDDLIGESQRAFTGGIGIDNRVGADLSRPYAIIGLATRFIMRDMNFDDFNERDTSDEVSEIGSDELLSDENLRLPESAHMLVRIYAVEAWLARRIEETKLEVGEAALALQHAAMQTASAPGTVMRRREREAQTQKTLHFQQALNASQVRLLAYEAAETMLQEALAHASGERVLVEFYLSLENLVQEESQREVPASATANISHRLAAFGDVQQRVERVGIPYEDE